MNDLLWYIFNPNPGHALYSTGWVIAVLVGCGGLVVASFLLRMWRSKLSNAVTKKLSKSWATAALWFGIAGLFLVVCRVEGIQFFATRFLWGVWIVVLAFYLFIQVRLFTARHYEVLPRAAASDPRDKYLPGKKRK